MTSPAERAQRLGVALRLVAAGEKALRSGNVRVTTDDLLAVRDVADDDLVLLNACLIAEAELREQAFAALERLLALLPPGGTGGLAARIAALPPPAFAAAATELYNAGLVYGAPDEA